jgi:hypothetical protein
MTKERFRMTGGKKLRMTWSKGLAMTTRGHKAPQIWRIGI